MQNCILFYMLENVYHCYLSLHKDALRMAVIEGKAPDNHYSKGIKLSQGILKHHNVYILH